MKVVNCVSVVEVNVNRIGTKEIMMVIQKKDDVGDVETCET